MNIEQMIQTAALQAVTKLYGEVNPSLVQIQKTRKEFSGDFTLVVFPLLKTSRKAPDATAVEIGALKDQVYGQSNGGYAYESYYLGSFEGTWYDYFMQQTTEQVKTTLLYCEAARALDVELDDEDYASIDSTIANLETTASLYGTTLNTYLASSYGAGVGVKDVKKALELSALATKCSELISEEVIEAVTEDMINDEYADNRVDYDLIDYLMYTVSVKYEDAVKAVLGDDYNENYRSEETRLNSSHPNVSRMPSSA